MKAIRWLVFVLGMSLNIFPGSCPASKKPGNWMKGICIGKRRLAEKTKQWDAEISEQAPHRRIAWLSASGAENSRTIHCIAPSPSQTRIVLCLNYGPRGVVEKLGHNLRVVSARISGDLNRFKKRSESQTAPLEDGLIPKVANATLQRIGPRPWLLWRPGLTLMAL